MLIKPLKWEKVDSLSPMLLQVGEAHLWWADLNISKDLAEQLKPLLTEKQRLKLKRLLSEEQRCRYIAGRAYLRKLLTAYSNGADISLVYNQYGKPNLASNNPGIFFNYSDTLGKGIFCFTKNSEVGVDVESLNRKGNFRRIVERRFSKEEQIYLSNFNDGESFSQEFVYCWTRKEAYGKAIGLGLNYPLREHNFCCEEVTNESKDMSFNYSDSTSAWTFQQFIQNDNDEKFVICLVSSGTEKKMLIARQFVGLAVLDN